MMKTEELIKLHEMNFGPDYIPNPGRHLRIPRDDKHFEFSLKRLYARGCKTVLDVGAFDGWLDFLLIDRGFKVTGVELIKELADAAKRYAERNFIEYTVHQGRFMDVDIKEHFDAVMCYETLEHVSLDEVPVFVEKLESLCDQVVFISLPDQNHKDNPQHQWTPTEDLIVDMFDDRTNFRVQNFSYTQPGVPSNWFISYEV